MGRLALSHTLELTCGTLAKKFGRHSVSVTEMTVPKYSRTEHSSKNLQANTQKAKIHKLIKYSLQIIPEHPFLVPPDVPLTLFMPGLPQQDGFSTNVVFSRGRGGGLLFSTESCLFG